MDGQSIGYLLGTVIMPFILSYVLLWIYAKISKKNVISKRNVIILGIIILVISLLGRLGRASSNI